MKETAKKKNPEMARRNISTSVFILGNVEDKQENEDVQRGSLSLSLSLSLSARVAILTVG